jgi:hypothetical protein
MEASRNYSYFPKGDSAFVSNYRSISLLNNFSKLLEFGLERILMMVYVVQNYLASFRLHPSSGMWKFYKKPQRFGEWICLRPQVDGAG